MRNRYFWVLWFALLVVPAAAWAQQYPPPQSPQDAACRSEAANRVMADPQRHRVPVEVLGRRYWDQCMQRAKAAKPKRTRRSTRR